MKTVSWGWGVAALPMLLLFALPLAGLVLAVDWPVPLDGSMVSQAVWLSVWTSLVTTLLTFLTGTPLAFWLSRSTSPFRRWCDTLVDLPMVLPPAVAGVGLLLVFGRQGLLGGWLEHGGFQVAFTPLAVILAQFFVAAPFFVRSAAIGFAKVEAEIEAAAYLEGSSWQVFRHIIFPMAGTTIWGGLAMTWARALGEFGATLIFAGNFPGRTQTMPLAVYLGFELHMGTALVLSWILLGVSCVVLFPLKSVLHRARFS